MKLRFTPQATGDLQRIGSYLSARNPAAAQRVRASILDSLNVLTNFPEIGRRQTTKNVRKWVTRRYTYLVYYSVDRPSDEVVILSIQHPAMDRQYEDD